jgi:hypothetical protein
MNNLCICWFITHIFTGILIFKELTARRLYKSFGFKGLTYINIIINIQFLPNKEHRLRPSERPIREGSTGKKIAVHCEASALKTRCRIFNIERGGKYISH